MEKAFRISLNYTLQTNNMQNNSLLIVWIIVGLVVGFLLAQIFSMKHKLKDRQASIKGSKAVILGHVKEQMAAIHPDFPYHTKDMVFIGKGFDYLVLDGLSEGDLRQIIFVEVKSWNSVLNKNEKQIQAIINSKFVTYEIIRL